MPRPSRWPEILRAASEEFREKGYENATLEGIGARVGILKGSIYNYVGSKEELLLAVVEQPARALLSELDKLRADTQSSVTTRLQELVRMQVRIFSEWYPAAFVYLRHIGHVENSPRFAEFREMDAQYMAAVEGLLAEGAATGEFSLASDPRTVARLIVGMLDWMQHWFTPRGEEADRALADEVFAMALGGLIAGGSMRAMLASRARGAGAP
ncbi:transcriptional regulator, TetR family [Pseudonocardia thermophila]|jgi:Transcriptional regulator|uniref:Transcriptional regulator, TetR family n=1 Tax=Pseudonocardia thermophila TaxID=1848 RepID=A0A1M6T9Z8_PSETH|nr:TetR/AcrR family transcriptional regulator [Pseudonocardia thermophila]SHK53558.1 transcriptional regulator, TetR family [Pseudonocardia thermophila]